MRTLRPVIQSSVGSLPDSRIMTGSNKPSTLFKNPFTESLLLSSIKACHRSDGPLSSSDIGFHTKFSTSTASSGLLHSMLSENFKT